ncbi:glycosyltransferase [Candidatus Woesearchaeota archaeon]|nr:glycosyltransferase [Candidatus Woesearchaeota archaeon]
MDFITIIYLVFIFLSLYVSFLFLLLYFKNKQDLYNYELIKDLPTISVLIPAYNEERNIRETIEAVKNVDYPGELLEIIVINDGSKDNTYDLIKNIEGIKIINKENTGKADSLNQALKIAKGEILAVNDSDSFPEKDSFIKMVYYFKDESVGAVTSTVLVKNKNSLLEKLQAIEYAMIAYARKLLEYLDSVFVTPGALSMYRKKALIEINGFDKNNITEDIEVAWHLLSKLYIIKMCVAAKTYTVVPNRIKYWWKQRLRWDIGGFQTLNKYKHTLFRKKYRSLGIFVAPFFGSYILLSFIGFFVFLVVFLRKAFINYLFFYTSLLNNSKILRMDILNLYPTVFTFFGILLLVIFLVFCTIGLRTIDKTRLKNKKDIFVYLMFYVVLTPLILIHSVYRIIIGKIQW